MKKKMILILILCLFLITGCGGAKLSSEKSLKRYLKKNYPDETFKVISKKEIKIVGDDGGCDKPGKGHSFVVKSNKTKVEFKIEDKYHFNSFICEYVVSDEYLRAAETKFLAENSESRVESYYSCDDCIGLSFIREKYPTSEDMVEDVWNIITKLRKTYPFKYKKVRDKTYISLDNRDNVTTPVYLEELKTKKSVEKIVKNL